MQRLLSLIQSSYSEEVTPTTDLINDLGLDSLDLLDLVTSVESLYNVRIERTLLPHIRTPQHLYDLITR